MNIIMGLDIGGDDHITKPFKLGVLISRVNALLRRTKSIKKKFDWAKDDYYQAISRQTRISIRKPEIFTETINEQYFYE